jgi:DNA helicase-2/ATP-dependent DNA helicase PcrA
VINVPRRGIGDATVGRIVSHSIESGLGLDAALHDREGLALPTRADSALEEFRVLMAGLRRLAADEGFGGIAQLTKSVLVESGYQGMLLGVETLENRDRWENLMEFMAKADAFDKSAAGTLAEFLGEISLITDLDMVDEEQQKGAVQIMTMHMAKGLEFPQVFMVGMEERIFPHVRSMTDSEIEEERRLCYVAMTRAKEKLFLSWAARRFQYGSYDYQLPSRFLKEIPSELIEGYFKEKLKGGHSSVGLSEGRSSGSFAQGHGLDNRNGGYASEKLKEGHSSGNIREWRISGSQSEGGENPQPQAGKGGSFKPGDRIVHKLWGPGSIVSAKGAGSSLTYTVAFPDKGLRVLQADIAPIKRME